MQELINYGQFVIMKESIIQSNIKRKLEISGWFVTKLLQTTTNGIPDLLALRDGRVVFIEVKQPGKKPTILQSYRHEQIRKKGFEVITATGFNDINHLL